MLSGPIPFLISTKHIRSYMGICYLVQPNTAQYTALMPIVEKYRLLLL